MQLNALVIEDNVSSLELICEALHSAGIATQGTRSPLHASDLIDRHKFDGIFLDLAMPGLDGAAMSRRIRKSTRNSTTPIVVVGDEDRPGTKGVKDAFAAGAQFYLNKPLDRTKVMRLVHTAQGSLLREHLHHQTVEYRTEVRCRSGSGDCSGVILQISERGILFQFEGVLQTSESVRLSFHLPKAEHPVEARGTITRVMREPSRQHAACRFDSLSSVNVKALHDFLVSSAAS